MGRLLYTALGVVMAATSLRAADPPDPLAEARALYNQGDFDGAVVAAERARLVPARPDQGRPVLGRMDSADLIAARAYLERFRASAAADDLANARWRLSRLDPLRFTPRERVEFIVGLGEDLYFEESYGAAADVFASALDSADSQEGDARERVLEWWASALDQIARPRPDIERQGIYERVRERMQSELASHAGSATAAYWLAAAARGKGDVQAAWDAVEAGWVRASLTRDGGATLRTDLDHLMLMGIVPERAKALDQPTDNVRAEWERFKERWKKE
jgi:hypothetical protein